MQHKKDLLFRKQEILFALFSVTKAAFLFGTSGAVCP